MYGFSRNTPRRWPLISVRCYRELVLGWGVGVDAYQWLDTERVTPCVRVFSITGKVTLKFKFSLGMIHSILLAPSRDDFESKYKTLWRVRRWNKLFRTEDFIRVSLISFIQMCPLLKTFKKAHLILLKMSINKFNKTWLLSSTFEP